ncbi:E3 ubiquitin-protein ligase RING1 [Diplonema papillatum]|nr:E3 ubiquitin-protein ligase RING1 [Diplonema papillatum]
MVDERLAAAKKLLEKKATYLDGVAEVKRLVSAGVSEGALSVVQRAYAILISRHDDPLVWDRVLELLLEFEEKAAGLTKAESAKLGEWVAHVQRAKPNAAEEEEKKRKRDEMRNDPAYAQELDLEHKPRPTEPGIYTSLESLLQNALRNATSMEDLINIDLPPGFFIDVDDNDQRASRKAVSELLLFTIPAAAKPEQYTCVVCLESLPPRFKAKKMPCGHLFHEECLLEWLGKSNTCPTCRHAIPSVLTEWAEAQKVGEKAAKVVEKEQKSYC